VAEDDSVTVTVHSSVNPPSFVVTVMVAVPVAFAVTVPLLTDATVELLLLHVTPVLEALVGSTVAVKLPVDPTVMLSVDLLSDTPVTEILVSSSLSLLHEQNMQNVIMQKAIIRKHTFDDFEICFFMQYIFIIQYKLTQKLFKKKIDYLRFCLTRMDDFVN